MERPSKDKYYLSMALFVAERSTCLRRQFGAIIVNNDQIISSGYAGAPRGTPNCSDLKKCYRDARNIPPGKNYELCRSVHAEMNAAIHASRHEMLGGTIYIAGRNLKLEGAPVTQAMPCKLCRRIIINAGIARVVITDTNKKGFSEMNTEDWIRAAKVNPFAELDEDGY